MRVRASTLPAVTAAMLVLLMGTTGCATAHALKRADAYAMNGEWDSAITYYQQRLNDDPGDTEARRKLVLARTNSAAFHRAQGKKLFEARDLQRAQLELELAVRLDPTNQAAVVDLRHVNQAIADEASRTSADKTDIQRAIARSMVAEPAIPVLEHSATGLMTFDYRRAKIREIYKAIARLGGVNVMFDADVDNDATSFFLAGVEYERAWEVLTATHGHFSRVMAPNTILIAPDNQQKRRQYEPQVMRTFYLSNADPEQVATALQTLLQARQVSPIANLNAVAIRDTAAVVDVAARMVRSLDKSRGEVLLHVEVFEIDRTAIKQWGLSLSDYSTSVAALQGSGADGSPAGLSLSELAGLTNADIFITVPSLRYQFLQNDASFKLLAQPQLRASDGNEAHLLVGEEVPVVTTTFNPQSTVGGNVVPISSTEYRPVGIQITTTPRVHHDGTITLQLSLEVSAVQDDQAGTLNQPRFTTRSLTSTIRLEEGETNLLAGLLRDDERLVRTGFPLVQDIPVLRDIFGRTEREVIQTDIVLSITPYIVRMADITDEDLAAVYVGTEANISGGGGRRGNNRRGGDQDDEEGGVADQVPPIRVQVLPDSPGASVGDRLRFEVRADGSAEINNAGMRVSYDPRILRLIETTEGDLFRGDGTETSFQASASSGSVAIGVGRVGDSGGIAASGVIAVLEFECIGDGESPVQVISAALRDIDGRPLPVEFTPAQVTVSQD